MFFRAPERDLENMFGLTQRTSQILVGEYTLRNVIEGFLRDRKASNLSPRTLGFYREKLIKFESYCRERNIWTVDVLNADIIRSYMLYMAEVRGNNKGNVHSFYRSIRALLYWFENEYEPEGWKNPIKKVKAPKQSQEIIEPAGIDVISAMLATCQSENFFDDRDRAMLLALLDLGARAQEFLNLDITDLDESGAVIIAHGKGDKPRMVYLGKKSRKAIRKYLKQRTDVTPALWIARTGDRLSYGGLREMIEKRARLAGVKAPAIHGFRRQFALTMLRNDVDVFSLQRLLGHTSLAVLRQYLAQNDEDTRKAHLKGWGTRTCRCCAGTWRRRMRICGLRMRGSVRWSIRGCKVNSRRFERKGLCDGNIEGKKAGFEFQWTLNIGD